MPKQHKGLLTPERITLLRSWEYSGFNVNAAACIDTDDAAGRENLVRYLIRAPFSMNKICYDPAAQTVIYTTKMAEGPKRNFEIFDPQDFFASRISSTSPARTEHLSQGKEGWASVFSWLFLSGRGSSRAQSHGSQGVELDKHGLRHRNRPHQG